MTYSIAFALLAVVLTSTVYLLRWTFDPHLARIPGSLLARVSPFYRLSLVAAGQAPFQYADVHKKYGPVVRIGARHVSIADPAVIPVVFGAGSKFLKSNFYKTFRTIYAGRAIETIFSARTTEVHKALRHPIASYFSMSSMRFYEPYVDECSNLFVSAMHDLEGQTLDLAAWLQWYAFDVIASITFQRRFGFLEERRDVDDLIANVDEALQGLKILSQMPELDAPAKFLLHVVLALTGKTDALASFLEICDQEILRYDQSDDKSRDRTDFLSQLRGRVGSIGPGVPHENLINHLSNNLLAGSDTTAITLRACLYFVLRNPQALRSLRQEIESCTEGGTLSNIPTLEQTLQMPYLQAVIKEATRLHPGVGFPLQREVPAGGVTLAGSYMPAGTIVSVCAYVTQLDAAVFGPDVAEFRPERWLESGSGQLRLMDRSMLAFGAGARSCIGKNISIMEIGKLLTRILRDFDIRFVDPEQQWKLEAAWFWQQKDIPVVFSSRGI